MGRTFQEGAGRKFADLLAGEVAGGRGDAVDFGQGDQAVADAQQGEDVQVLAGLRHDAVVGGDDEDHAVHAAGAGDHGLDEILVARHVDDADLPSAIVHGAKPSSIDMPRSFSSLSRSVSQPVRSLTRAVLPWST